MSAMQQNGLPLNIFFKKLKRRMIHLSRSETYLTSFFFTSNFTASHLEERMQWK